MLYNRFQESDQRYNSLFINTLQQKTIQFKFQTVHQWAKAVLCMGSGGSIMIYWIGGM